MTKLTPNKRKSDNKADPRYSYQTTTAPENLVKARGNGMLAHYKHMSEVGRAIKGMEVTKATAYLKRVLAKKDVIAYRQHCGGRGRHAQAKNHGPTPSASGFPSKSSAMMIKLLENLKANAAGNNTSKASKVEGELVLKHVVVNRAPRYRRRTYRAHGRIGNYVRSPAHVEIVAEAKAAKVVPQAPAPVVAVTRKALALDKYHKIRVGGGEKAKA